MGNIKKMDAAALEARKTYQREWQRKNPDKVREYKARYWARKAAGLVGQQETSAPARAE